MVEPFSFEEIQSCVPWDRTERQEFVTDEEFTKESVEKYHNEFLDENTPPEERIKSFDLMKIAEDSIRWETINKACKKYNQQVMRGIIEKELERRLIRIRQWRNKVYQDHDELRKRGISFIEREKLINNKRLKFCDEHEAELLKAQKSFKPRSLWEWFGEEQYDEAIHHGMLYSIRINFDQTYETLL